MLLTRVNTLGKTLHDLATYVDGVVRGDAACLITGVATLMSAIPGDITFLSNPHYRKYLSATRASAVILSSEDKNACAAAALVVDNPYVAYARIATCLYDEVERYAPPVFIPQRVLTRTLKLMQAHPSGHTVSLKRRLKLLHM